MEKKLVLILLIVILVLTLMLLGGGLLRKDRKIDPEAYKPGPLLSKLDGFFAKRRPPFKVERMAGCNRAGNVLMAPANGECAVVIDTAKAKSSSFTLAKEAGDVRLCFDLSREGITKCLMTPSQQRRLKDDPARFVVTSDSAFLHLYCGGAAACRVTVK
ncbi:MAG TPA: hypothetical protein VFU23_02955 [Gemmatimonadales bacterium]|nr:hypothetical protein [Gemmatimonadales bacterium]